MTKLIQPIEPRCSVLKSYNASAASVNTTRAKSTDIDGQSTSEEFYMVGSHNEHNKCFSLLCARKLRSKMEAPPLEEFRLPCSAPGATKHFAMVRKLYYPWFYELHAIDERLFENLFEKLFKSFLLVFF